MDSYRVGSMFFTAGADLVMDGFTVATETGWLDTPDMRRQQVDIPQGHGAFDLPGFLSARVVALSGLVSASSVGKFLWLRSQITGLMADGSLGKVVGELSGVTLWGNARLVKTNFAPIVWGQTANYQIQFWFANPRLFGSTQIFTGGSPSYHYGNFPAAPVHTVTATTAMSGYTIAGPAGKLFTVTVACNPGSPHTIDMSTGQLIVNGIVSFGNVSRADTWVIPGGVAVTHTLTLVSGSGTLLTAVTDTYV
jgi:hypothetical protein